MSNGWVEVIIWRFITLDVSKQVDVQFQDEVNYVPYLR